MALPNWEKRYNEIQKLKEKNIIIAKLADSYTIQTSSTSESIKNLVEVNKVGSKLSVKNGVIKIGKGVSKVLVSYNAMSKSIASTYSTFTYLMKNTTTLTQESHYYSSIQDQITVSHSPILLDVSENDEIYINCYGGAGNKIYGAGYYWTSITVEVVE